jgi:hypothetical protein
LCFLTSCPSQQQKTLTNTESGAAAGGTALALGPNPTTNPSGGTIGQGAADINNAEGFFKALASGDRETIMQTLQAPISTISSQYDTGRASAEEFAPRGGGRAAALEELPFQKAGAIEGLVQGAQETGVEGEANIGSMLSNLGLGELTAGSSIASNTVGELQNQQQISGAAGAASGQAIGSLIALLAL